MPTVTIQDKELWVINCFVNSRWFRGKFQLKIRWEDQNKEQDDWRGYEEILQEAVDWHQELSVSNEPSGDLVRPMIEEYYMWHPGAPRHDDPPHRHAAPLRHRALRRK